MIRCELVREGEGTVLPMTHSHLTRRTSLGFAPGAHAFLDRLEATLDDEPLPDWIRRVEELRPSYPSAPSWRS